MLLSSHILAEVEALCDRVTIIRAGRTVETGTLADIAAPHPHVIDAEISADGSPTTASAPGVHDLRVEGNRVRSTWTPPACRPRCGMLTGSASQSLVSQPPSLEELFLRHYRERASAPLAESAP